MTFEFSDNDTFENIISLLTSNGKIILFDEQNGFNTPSEISCDINDCIPYQNHEALKKIGEEMAKKYNLTFLYRDFRPGFNIQLLFQSICMEFFGDQI